MLASVVMTAIAFCQAWHAEVFDALPSVLCPPEENTILTEKKSFIKNDREMLNKSPLHLSLLGPLSRLINSKLSR